MSHQLSNNLINYDTYDMLNCFKKISCSYSCNAYMQKTPYLVESRGQNFKQNKPFSNCGGKVSIMKVLSE